MKLLYAVIILLEIKLQLIGAAPGNDSPHTDDLQTKKRLIRSYNEKLNVSMEQICIELDALMEQILKNEIVQGSSTPVLQEFKNNMTHFQQIYDFYKAFGYNELLVTTFEDMVNAYYTTTSSNQKDSLLIKQLLKTHGYDHLREKFKNDFKKFVTDQILPQFEELKIPTPPTKFDTKLIKWINILRECDKYECFLKTFKKVTLSPKDRFVSYIQRQLFDMTILYTNYATVFAKDTLNDPKLLRLRQPLRQILENNLQEVLTTREVVEHDYQIFFIPLSIHSIKFVFISNDDISYKDYEMIMKLLNDHGYTQLEINHKAQYDEFLKNDLLREYEIFKASLKQQDLLKEKDFLETFEKLKKATSFEERVEIVNAADKKVFEKVQIY